MQPQTEHVQGHNCPGEQQAQRNGGGDSGQELSRGRARVAIENEPYSLQGEEGRRAGGGGLRGGKGTGGPAAVQEERGREGEEDAGHEEEQAENAQGERARRQRRDGEFGGCG